EVLEVEPMDVELITLGISCQGENNGFASANITGGIEPYEINWTGPGGFTSTGLTVTDLIAGIYNLSVSDSVGCTFTDQFEITDPAPLSIAEEVFDASCSATPDGSVDITLTGG